MNTATTTLTLHEGFFARRNWRDWLFAALVIAGGLYAFNRYHAAMDVYEKGILLGTLPCAIWLGWFWRPVQTLAAVVTVGARWHSCAAWYVDSNSASGSLARAQLIVVPAAPMRGLTSPGADVAIAQSRPVSISPSRHRAAFASIRLSRPLPAERAAMQKGKQGASGRHAFSPLTICSFPQRGTTHTVATTSRHVPLAMQSCVVGSVVLAPLDPSVASWLE
jgi:hypothetical protein